MTAAERNRIRREYTRCVRYCSREKAITIVAMRSRSRTIAAVRDATDDLS